MNSRPPTPKQVERWFKRACVRCGRRGWSGSRWPEGALCRTCYARALDTYSRRASCGSERMVPGLADDGGRLCTECAGIPGAGATPRVGATARVQPASRIVRLTVDDVCHVDGQVFLRLGDPPVPVPTPFADLLLALVGDRANMVTATNHDAPWLFPGRRAGQPLLPRSLAPALQAQGIPVQNGRTAAIRQLVLQAPAPVVAGMLGYLDTTTTRLVMETGGTWSRYAPGVRGQHR